MFSNISERQGKKDFAFSFALWDPDTDVLTGRLANSKARNAGPSLLQACSR